MDIGHEYTKGVRTLSNGYAGATRTLSPRRARAQAGLRQWQHGRGGGGGGGPGVRIPAAARALRPPRDRAEFLSLTERYILLPKRAPCSRPRHWRSKPSGGGGVLGSLCQKIINYTTSSSSSSCRAVVSESASSSPTPPPRDCGRGQKVVIKSTAATIIMATPVTESSHARLHALVVPTFTLADPSRWAMRSSGHVCCRGGSNRSTALL